MAKETDSTCNSWEDLMDEKVLEAQLSKITLANQQKSGKQGQNMAKTPSSQGSKGGGGAPQAPQIKVLPRPTNAQKSEPPPAPGMFNVVIEGSTRTPYQPQVRILKREPQKKQNQDNVQPSTTNTNSAPKQENGSLSQTLASMAKSLEEREALYQKARLRILGAAKAEEEEPSIKNSLITTASLAATASSSPSSSNTSPNSSPNKRYNSRHSSGNSSSTSHHRGNGDSHSNTATNGPSPMVPVLRQPHGPEGDSRGFSANR